jgi:hypothetical protein
MEIMRVPASRLLTVCCLICGFPFAGGAAELVLQKVPPLTVEQTPAYPENLARHYFGAQIEVAPDGNSAAALLCDDPTSAYPLPTGNKTLLITLSKIENIDSISFSNHGVRGNVAIATSNSKLPSDSSQWHVVSQQELTSEAVQAKIGPSEAKYVMLSFDVTEPGQIAGLGVYSPPSVAAFTMPRARKTNSDRSGAFALVNYNLTDLHAKARALYVSSGDDVRQANNMIDDQSSTIYGFSPSDAEPTAVIDLGKVTALRRICALYSPRQGNVDFYVVDSLPGVSQGNPPKTLKLDGAALAGLKSVGTVSDGTGLAAIDFPATSGRYVVVKWTPLSQQDTPFTVAEIAAFGGSDHGNLIVANTAASTQDRVESDGKTMVDGKDAKDFKEMPEEAPAEGPPPPFSAPPPFVFVPEIVPTSP